MSSSILPRPSGPILSASMGIMDDDFEPSYERTRKVNPIFKIYKPRRDFDHNDSKKQGSAIQIDFSKNKAGIPGMFLKMSRQTGPFTADGNCDFDWNKTRIFFKLSVWDISKILTVLTYAEPFIEFVNMSDEGKRIIQLTNLGNHKDRYVQSQVALFEKGDDTHEPREIGLNPKSVGIRIIEDGEQPMRLTLDVEEVVGMRIFLEEGLRRIFYASADF